MALDQIPVSQIKKIEIIKGPSSSLYGSEAMAGVINIITEHNNDDQLHFSSRYGISEDTFSSEGLNNGSGDLIIAGSKIFDQINLEFQ